MGNQMDADLPEALIQLKSSRGRQYLPNKRMYVLPEKWKRQPGTLMSFYRCLPPGIKFLKDIPDNLYWWPEVTFLAHTERTLVTSVGAFLDRPGYAPMAASSRVHGLLYTLTYGNNIQYSIIKGTQTSSLPNITAHPSGDLITWAGQCKINVMNLTKYSKASHSAAFGCTFFCTAIAPNGNYLAAMSRCSECIKMETFILHERSFLPQFTTSCHSICPGFKTDLRNQARFQCKFSADSDYIACASSHGQLFVVRRYELTPRCIIIPSLLSHEVLATEHSFDFDPRFLNRYLMFCDTAGMVHLCDLDRNSIVRSCDLEVQAAVQCLKYSPTGHVLAIAFSNGVINICGPDSVEVLYTLDMTTLDPDSQLVPNAQGRLPDVINMSFSTTGNLLATSATDGIIRIWQLMPEMSLTALCRRAILQYVPKQQLFRLHLPVRLLKELLQWPED